MANSVLGMNEGTGKWINFDLDGTVNTQVIRVDKGTISTIGTLPSLPGGTINLVGSGTITKVEGGTIGLITRVGNVGTLEVGTITTLPNTPGGTINLVSNLTNGTVRISVGTITTGTIDSVTTVSNLTNGSVRITVGTITVLPNIPGGTVGEVTSVTNLVGGTVTKLTQGSIQVTAGTVSAGTINAGTMTAVPYPSAQVLSAGTTTSGTIGTLIAAPGAGTGIYINSLIVNAISGTPEITTSFALQAAGNQTVNRGAYVAGGGVALSFPHPSYYGTAAAALTFNILSGSGTVSYAVTYTTKGTP